MTQEEAIALLNEQYETCKRIYDCSADQRKSYPSVPQFMEALGMALSALHPITREQVKKMRGEWKHRFTTDDSVFCTSCKTTFRAYYDEYNFCPDCGAPMTDKAVDILWKRLEEALKDGN